MRKFFTSLQLITFSVTINYFSSYNKLNKNEFSKMTHSFFKFKLCGFNPYSKNLICLRNSLVFSSMMQLIQIDSRDGERSCYVKRKNAHQFCINRPFETTI